MRISLITSVPLVPPWDQGDKNLAYTLTRVLSRHRFQVLTARKAPRPLGANLDLAPVYRNTRPSLWQKAHVYGWLLRQRPSDDPDLYHLVYRPYALSSWLSRWLPPFRRRPTLHTVPATANKEALARHLFFADRVVALSRYGQRQLQALGLENVAYVPAGINVQQWAALARWTDHLKAHLGIAGHPTVLYPGHYGPGYGADVLVRALPAIVAAVPDVRIIFACRPRAAGDAAREQTLRNTLAQVGLAKTGLFYNTVADMHPLIGATDVTVLPLETMHDKVDIPTTLLESLAAGKPIVISDLAPMNELLHENGTDLGRPIPPGDANALAEAIVPLLQDDALRTRRVQSGQQLIATHYDIRPVARQYDTLYREMVL